MAKRKVAGVGAIDRAIKSTRAKISKRKSKVTAEKRAKKKKATLERVKKQLASLSKRKKR